MLSVHLLIGFIFISLTPIVSYGCPIICFYQADLRIVDCVSKPNSIPENSVRLKCQIGNYLDYPVIKIGSGETVNGFRPLSLANTNSVKIANLYLNVSVKSIDSDSFSGSFRNLNSVFVYSVDGIDTKAFSRMPSLRELQIENFNAKSMPKYLIIDSTNVQRKMYLRLNVICYTCPDTDSLDNLVYFHVIPNSAADKSVVYSNIKLSKCQRKYVEDVCGVSTGKTVEANSLDWKQSKFLIILFFSLFTFVMIIVLLVVLFFMKKRYQRDMKSVKSRYVSEVFLEGKNGGLGNRLLTQ